MMPLALQRPAQKTCHSEAGEIDEEDEMLEEVKKVKGQLRMHPRRLMPSKLQRLQPRVRHGEVRGIDEEANNMAIEEVSYKGHRDLLPTELLEAV